MSDISSGGPGPDVIRHVAKMFRERETRAAALQKRFGHTGLPNTAELAGHRAVCVGSQMRFVDLRWAPQNFMARLLVETLGEAWFREQLEAATDPATTPHPIISWYLDTMEWQERHADKDGHVHAVVSGPARAWFLLAYDVWVLSHHALLQPLLPRLRDLRQFQGARYELATYALFIRGGFALHPEKETDNSTQHVEFIAEHRTTGERIAVEAKSRHRPGVLGYPGEGHPTSAEPAITGRLRDALAQHRRELPYVICVELNLPPAATEEEAREMMDSAQQEVELIVQEYTQNGEKFPATLVVVTNYCHHYGSPDEHDPGGYQCAVVVRDPAYPFLHPETQSQIIQALDSYGNLPKSWDDFDR